MLLPIRRFFVTLLLSATVSFAAFGQGCVIDTSNYDLISPPSENLPCIERNRPYNATIQLYAIPSITFSVDSYLITTFLNLPSGITYSLNPPSGKLYPQKRGCVYLSGTTNDAAGDYTVDYNGYVYLQLGTPSFDFIRMNYPGQLPDVILTVIEQGTQCPNIATGIESMSANSKIDFSVYPNPSSGVFNLKINDGLISNAIINVSDAMGKVVYSAKTDNTNLAKNTIDLSACAKGLYLVQLKNAKGFVSKLISVE